MEKQLWLAIGICALGTWALRLLPLLWIQYQQRKRSQASENSVPAWLTLLGPLMIAAMLGASLVPTRTDWIGVVATLVGIVTTALAWRRYRAIGKPIVCGVLAFGVITGLLRLL